MKKSKVLLTSMITAFSAGSVGICLTSLTSCNRVDYSQYSVACMGDSITWGAEPRTGLQMNRPFPTALREDVGFGRSANYGVGSSTVCASTAGYSYYPMCDRLNKISTNANLIIFWGGINDWKNGCTLGNETDTDHTTFYGAMDIVCKFLKERRDARDDVFVMVMTPLPAKMSEGKKWDIGEFWNAIDYKCKEYDIPMLDMYNESGFEGEWVLKESDGLHPTQNYVDTILVPKVRKFIRQHLEK